MQAHTHIQTHIHAAITYIHTNGPADRQTHTDTYSDTHMLMHTYRLPEQTDRQTDLPTDGHIQTLQ